MYRNQSFTENISSRKRNEDYDLCNAEVGRKFIVQWSPQDGARYLSKNRYASPRSLSKSVPRRNRGLVRYNINRSLNFDLGTRNRADCFGSPNSSSDSNLSTEGDANYLSRSAKILRALNIDYSPQRRTGPGIRKINKSLNFDLSPSPKRLPNFNNSRLNNLTKNLVSPLSKINKTLNFEPSSGESSVNSRLDSSVESIDENQNQTPSQRNRKAKKSLNYPPSPAFRSKNFGSPNASTVRSPMLRNELRTKIDDIVESSMTPNLQSSKRNLMRTKFDDFGASTPRNLFNDFRDDDNEEHLVVDRDERPHTPENFIKIIPESMSAIKKSHKKERVLGRLGKAIAYQAETRSGSEQFVDSAMDVEVEEHRPTTPFLTVEQYDSPQRSINSIKQSHKKNKSKRKSYVDYSEDEMSDTGSIFDYNDETRASIEDSSKEEKRTTTDEAEEEKTKENDRMGEKLSCPIKIALLAENFNSPEGEKDSGELEISRKACGNFGESSRAGTSADNFVGTPEKSTGNDRPGTPENRINFLQHIMTDSIKKSHKKVKDSNKKLLFKPRKIQAEEDKSIVNPVTNNIALEEDRATTPENTNSSRMLLSQFSSVKKSHKKDKHRRMISGSLERKKFFVGDAATNSEGESHNSSLSSSISDFLGFSPRRISTDDIGKAQDRSNASITNEFSSSDNSNDAHYYSLESGNLETEECEMGVGTLSNADFPKSSPNKRKSVSSDSLQSATSKSPGNEASVSYESAEEEFKIFTPIKKRKSLNIVAPIARRICEGNDSVTDNNALTEERRMIDSSIARCSTPTTGRVSCLKLIESSFKTPERNADDNFVAITDNSHSESRDTENSASDVNDGRATPLNQSTAVLMAGINSIKKSHKKDKRGNTARRFLICAQDNESRVPESASGHDNDSSKSSQSRESPKPSTSFDDSIGRTEIVKNTNEQVKTPPNCLEAKNYLKLLRTESIKRSHKKVRERKKYRKVVVESELSNDGSIFDDAERSVNAENEDSKESDNGTSKEDRACTMLDCAPETENVQNFVHEDHRCEIRPDSDDEFFEEGSILEHEEKLENPRENVADTERANTSLN